MLLTLLLSTLALAYDLPTLSVDLDRDGRADTVRVLEGAADGDFHVLEVSLTASAGTLRFGKLLGKQYAEMNAEQKKETSYCNSLVERKLRTAAPGAFQVLEFGGDYEGCAGSWYRTLVIRLVGGELVVTRELAGSDSWSMGDPSPILNLSFNYAAGKLSGDSHDHHDKQGKPAEGAVALNCGGPVALANFEREHFPACAREAAKALAKKIGMDCGRAFDSNSCPVR